MRDAILLSNLSMHSSEAAACNHPKHLSMQSSEASSACNHGMWNTLEAVNVMREAINMKSWHVEHLGGRERGAIAE